MKPKVIKLQEGDRVIAVVPECCNGPGWANTPTWVYIETNDGRLRKECIQSDERTTELHTLFHVGVAMGWALINAVPICRKKNHN